jgi:hypothetical protein
MRPLDVTARRTRPSRRGTRAAVRSLRSRSGTTRRLRPRTDRWAATGAGDRDRQVVRWPGRPLDQPELRRRPSAGRAGARRGRRNHHALPGRPAICITGVNILGKAHGSGPIETHRAGTDFRARRGAKDPGKTLGIGPGSVIEWEQEGDKLVVRKAAKYSMADLHRALFPKGPPRRKSAKALRDGIAAHIRKKHASR